MATLVYHSAKILRMPAAEMTIAGYLHDLGKTMWPKELFFKYPLQPVDWEYIKAHPVIGADMAADIWPNMPSLIKQLIRSHHERPDGSGYPDGLSAISGEILLLAACDAFDAMVIKREYNGVSMPFEYALKEISKFTPTQIVSVLAQVNGAHQINNHKDRKGAIGIG